MCDKSQSVTVAAAHGAATANYRIAQQGQRKRKVHRGFKSPASSDVFLFRFP